MRVLLLSLSQRGKNQEKAWFGEAEENYIGKAQNVFVHVFVQVPYLCIYRVASGFAHEMWRSSVFLLHFKHVQTFKLRFSVTWAPLGRQQPLFDPCSEVNSAAILTFNSSNRWLGVRVELLGTWLFFEVEQLNKLNWKQPTFRKKWPLWGFGPGHGPHRPHLLPMCSLQLGARLLAAFISSLLGLGFWLLRGQLPASFVGMCFIWNSSLNRFFKDIISISQWRSWVLSCPWLPAVSLGACCNVAPRNLATSLGFNCIFSSQAWHSFHQTTTSDFYPQETCRNRGQSRGNIS